MRCAAQTSLSRTFLHVASNQYPTFVFNLLPMIPRIIHTHRCFFILRVLQVVQAFHIVFVSLCEFNLPFAAMQEFPGVEADGRARSLPRAHSYASPRFQATVCHCPLFLSRLISPEASVSRMVQEVLMPWTLLCQATKLCVFLRRPCCLV